MADMPRALARTLAPSVKHRTQNSLYTSYNRKDLHQFNSMLQILLMKFDYNNVYLYTNVAHFC